MFLNKVMEVQILSPRIGDVRKVSDPPKEEKDCGKVSSNATKCKEWEGRVFVMFMVFGIASLTPWNMFITATAYFESKFNNSTADIEENFPNYFQTGAICVDVFVSFLAVLLVRKFSTAMLVYISNSLMLLMFAVTAMLAKVDSSGWSLEFFVLTEILFCCMCGGGALYISTMWAITSAINSMYTEAFLIGMSTAGIIAALLNIITLAIPGIDFVESGFWYFTGATLILLLALLLFARFHCHHYQAHYRQIGTSESPDSSLSSSSQKSSFTKLVRDTLAQGYSCFFMLYLTFIVFPGVLSTLQSTADSGSIWAVRYFKPVSLFLVFNVGDLMGRLIARVAEFPGRVLIPWYTTARVVFVVMMIMCNLQPRSLPVWFSDDYTPTVIIFLFGVTNGQVLTLCLRYAPELSDDKTDKQTIGTIIGVHGALGRVLGSLSTYFVFMILK